MTLYDSILDYEEQHEKAILVAASQKDFETHLLIRLTAKSSMEKYVAKTKILLNAAHKLGNSSLTEKNLDYLVDYLDKVEFTPSGVDLLAPLKSACKSLYGLRTEGIKANIEFYQQLLSHEGQASTYKEAVRRQFKNEENYILALQKRFEAQIEFDQRLSAILPLTSENVKQSYEEAITEVEEMAIKYLFS